MFARWRFTVPSARCSEEAIWWLERPRAAKSRISSSLALRMLSIPSSVPSTIEQGIPIVWDLGYDLHAPVGGEDPRKALPEHGVVVRKQHPDQPVGFRVRVSVLSQHPPAPFCFRKGIVPSTPFGARIFASW